MLAPQTGRELERRTCVEDDACVVAACRGPQGSLLADTDAVDLAGVAADLTDGVAAVGGNAMAELLFAVSDRDDARAVPIPGQVVDPPGDDRILPPSRPTALRCAIPYPDRARAVS